MCLPVMVLKLDFTGIQWFGNESRSLEILTIRCWKQGYCYGVIISFGDSVSRQVGLDKGYRVPKFEI